MGTACDKLERLQHEDILGDSLEKAQALMQIFWGASLGEHNEETLQWFSMAMLENVRNANSAWKALRSKQAIC